MTKKNKKIKFVTSCKEGCPLGEVLPEEEVCPDCIVELREKLSEEAKENKEKAEEIILAAQCTIASAEAVIDDPENKYMGVCSSCEQATALSMQSDMCGPCTFGEAETIMGNW